MTWTWLDEAVWKWANFGYYHKHFCGKQIPEQELADEMFGALDDAYENIDRMARVIRELARALWKLQTDRDANVFDDLSEEADSIVQEIIK